LAKEVLGLVRPEALVAHVLASGMVYKVVTSHHHGGLFVSRQGVGVDGGQWAIRVFAKHPHHGGPGHVGNDGGTNLASLGVND